MGKLLSMGLSYPETNDLTHRIIGSAMEVHKYFGPGLGEVTYEESLYWELQDSALNPQRQFRVPIDFKSRRLKSSYRVDLLVRASVVVEVKAVEKLIPLHQAQVLTYLKLTGCRVGLLINFNVINLLDGIKRISL